MKIGLYCAFDTVSKSVLCSMSSANDGTVIRENYLALRRVVPDVESDLRIYKIADFDNQSMSIAPLPSPVVVSWDSYKFPEAVLNPPPKENKNK